jgi:hypothetical protein
VAWEQEEIRVAVDGPSVQMPTIPNGADWRKGKMPIGKTPVVRQMLSPQRYAVGHSTTRCCGPKISR